MPVVPASELTTLRTQQPHTARVAWYLALAPYGDATFTALVNDAGIAQGEREIVYAGDVGEATVEAGMTLWVGSAAGLHDRGRVRIRAINIGANIITVAENDDIEWADGLFLTCPGSDGFRELWGIYPRITEAGGIVTFFEDYDELYVNPLDDVLPPKANAGPPACEFLGVGGFVDVSFVGDESFTPEIGAAIATYAWDFADGVVQSGAANQAGTCENPNVVRFSTTGFRYISLTVTDNTGVARTGTVYVPVWIFNRTTATPLLVESQSQDGAPEWKLSVRAFSTETVADDVFYNYPDGALCVLFTETIYPNDETDLGGFCHRPNIRFAGWLDAESLSFNHDSGTIQFSAVSHDTRLGELPGFAYTLEDSATPGDWYEVNDLDIDRVLHAHLERRTTMNQVCHVERLNEPARRVAIQGFPDASLYSQAQEHLLKDAMVTMLSDRQGIMRVRRDPQFMDVVDRNAVDVIASMTASDLLNEVDEDRRKQIQFGYIRMGGFAYETPLLAEAPGVAPAQNETAGYIEGFLVEDQPEINLWAGLWFKKENNDYRDVPVEIRGYWPVFDPAFQEYIRLTITDPLGRNVFTDQRFIVRRVTYGDLVADGTATTRLIIEKETDLLTGSTVTIPIPPPPESPPPPPTPPVVTIDPPEIVLVHDRHQVYSTPDFGALNPTWTNITGLIEGVIFAVECDHFDGVGAWALTGTDNVDADDDAVDVGLWRTDDVTVVAPVWTLVFTQEDGKTLHDAGAASWNGGCDGISPYPDWGQLRSVNPTEAGMCVIAEARPQGLSCFVGDVTSFFQVDSTGGWILWNDQIPMVNNTGTWELNCNECSGTAASNPGVKFVAFGGYVNQSEWRSCHQVYFGVGGYTSLTPAGIIHEREAGFCTGPAACSCDATCRTQEPWPKHGDLLFNPCICLNGSTHVIFYEGKWWGQTQLDFAAANAGGLYNGSDGEVDDALWFNYAFCNICSHSNHIYHCKQIGGRINELYIDLIASGQTSDLMFGVGGPGFFAGVIGHIRAIWDEDQTVVLVRKDQPDALQPNDSVVWTYDATNGLQDKTGNLTGITWYGTGRALPLTAAWNHRWDNVGFSAFQVPIQ